MLGKFDLISAIRDIQSLSDNALGIPERKVLKSLANAARLILVPDIAKVSPSASLLPDDVISMLQSIRDHATTENVDGSKPLAQLESLRLLPHLTGLKAKLPLLRIAAARVIATVNDPVAVEALIVALKDSDGRVRAAAATGLEKLTGKTFGEDAAQWEAWWQEAHATFKGPQ